MRTIAVQLCATLLVASATPLAAQGRHEGYAYAAQGKDLLYRESHWLLGSDSYVLYRCPDGKPFARKRVIAGQQASAPDFVTDDARDGYREGVRSDGLKHTVFYRANEGSQERSEAIDKPDNAIIDAGFDAYIVENWDQIAVNDRRNVQFLIPSRLGYTDFSITRLADDKVSGVQARRYQLKLDAWYGFALPQIDVAYAVAGRQLLRYEGLGNIRSNDGNNLSVRVEFPPAMQGDNAENSIGDPTGVALTGRCPL